MLDTSWDDVVNAKIERNVQRWDEETGAMRGQFNTALYDIYDVLYEFYEDGRLRSAASDAIDEPNKLETKMKAAIDERGM